MQRTIVIRRDYLHYVRKYSRFEKRHKNMSVHLSPAFRYAICLTQIIPIFSSSK